MKSSKINFPRRLFGGCVATLGMLAMAATGAQQTAPEKSYDVEFLGLVIDDALIQHGKETYVLAGCAYCHGVDLQPLGEAADLMHSPMVGADDNGNVIGPVVRAGFPQTLSLSPMPQYSDLSEQQIVAIARWIHYARQQGRFQELTAVADRRGDAAAGKKYFAQACSECHSTGGDLAHVGRTHDRASLRAQILMPDALKGPASFKVSERRDPKSLGRLRHAALLENYSAEDVLSLVECLRTAK
jgi:mono/diheme cytochrome c family protein